MLFRAMRNINLIMFMIISIRIMRDELYGDMKKS